MAAGNGVAGGWTACACAKSGLRVLVNIVRTTAATGTIAPVHCHQVGITDAATALRHRLAAAALHSGILLRRWPLLLLHHRLRDQHALHLGVDATTATTAI